MDGVSDSHAGVLFVVVVWQEEEVELVTRCGRVRDILGVRNVLRA